MICQGIRPHPPQVLFILTEWHTLENRPQYLSEDTKQFEIIAFYV